MKHSVNIALTVCWGNAEATAAGTWAALLAVTGHRSDHAQMAIADQEVMQRFSSLASEMQEARMLLRAETVGRCAILGGGR